ncbi:ATP-binding cassette domain-containing protein [Streptomyces sp. CA-210063]|uniref:ABC transporter permease subunit n=1 Tax=Streptomyces sp. CA-210063 TaxID=2801029 RepID=UPI00214B6E99|nr:ATP-binding cassette domain-containing protein [Streptomyces sp. CA-210063]UUU34982.1 ATP-binding cassette domain-containing protein [Streptomyces sp. CA-210063]
MASLTYDLTLAGLSVGSAAALTGIGLIVTYRATGVLNFAHGAIAMVCAYLLRQFTVEWGRPLWLGASVTLLVVAPALGLALERFVFRPLAVLGGDPAQTLVASIGVFVLLVGGAALLWGQGARADAPTVVSADPWVPLAVAVAVAAAVGAATRWTRFGRELRAVVDDRSLAVLGGIDADRVAAAGWAFGSFTAGLTGVLLAPYVRLDPYGLPLLVMEVVAVAVAARMRSLPVAVVVALGIGIAQSQLTRLHPSGWAEPLLQAVGANLFVVALLVAALVLPGVGTRDALPRTATARVETPAGVWIVAVLLFLIPLGFAGRDLHTSVQVPALGVILLSLVVVTGRGGQISLGQAAYAGLGALFTALLSAGRFPYFTVLPELTSLLVAVLLVAPLGLLTGWPAISRRGLALALATFAVGVGVSRFVFAQPYATSGLTLTRPAGFEGDRAYYVLELGLLALALLVTRALRRGRTGRALAAMRDHEAGASAAGVRVPSLKLTAFVAGAALAALGGGLLAMGVRAFDPAAYDPVRGLLWFAAIVVLGADSTLGALAAAALLVGLDAGTKGGVAAAVIGVLAVLVGRFPGGPYEAVRAGVLRLRPGAVRGTEPAAGQRARLTPVGVRVRERVRAGARAGAARQRPTALAGATATAGASAADGRAAKAGQDAGDATAPAVAAADGWARAGSAEGAGQDMDGRSNGREPTEGGSANSGTHAADTTDTGRRRGGPGRRRTPTGSGLSPRGEGTPTEGMPNEGTPGGAPQEGATQDGATQDGATQDGATQDGATQDGARQGEGTPGGAPQSETTPGEATPSRATPDEGTPSRATPDEATPYRATPDEGTPSRATPDGATPYRATPGEATPGDRRPSGAEPMQRGGEQSGKPDHTPDQLSARHPDTRTGHGPPVSPNHPPRPASGHVPPAGPNHPPRPGPVAGPAPVDGATHTPHPTPPPTPSLRARHLHVRYGEFTALDGVDLDVLPGRVSAVVGPNGAGKSTLFHCLAGTLRPVQGRVSFGGRDITRLPAHARTRLGIARTFQQLAVFPSLTVAENVRVGAEQGRVADPGAVERALRLFGLDGPVRMSPAAGLPTGTLRRVELARALAGSPRVLLLDEPAAGLDTGEVAALTRVLRALADDGTALLVVEHDLDLVADLADVVHVMAAGRIVTSGPADHVLRSLDPLDPAVER